MGPGAPKTEWRVPMKAKVLLYLLVICGCLVAANAFPKELYRWTDEQGGVHFTDNPDSIPEKYRSKV